MRTIGSIILIINAVLVSQTNTTQIPHEATASEMSRSSETEPVNQSKAILDSENLKVCLRTIETLGSQMVAMARQFRDRDNEQCPACASQQEPTAKIDFGQRITGTTISEEDSRKLDAIEFVRCTKRELDARHQFCQEVTSRRLRAICMDRNEALIKFCVDRFDQVVRYDQPIGLMTSYGKFVYQSPLKIQHLLENGPVARVEVRIQEYLEKDDYFNDVTDKAALQTRFQHITAPCNPIIRGMESAEAIIKYSHKNFWEVTDDDEVLKLFTLYKLCIALIDKYIKRY